MCGRVSHGGQLRPAWGCGGPGRGEHSTRDVRGEREGCRVVGVIDKQGVACVMGAPHSASGRAVGLGGGVGAMKVTAVARVCLCSGLPGSTGTSQGDITGGDIIGHSAPRGRKTQWDSVIARPYLDALEAIP